MSEQDGSQTNGQTSATSLPPRWQASSKRQKKTARIPIKVVAAIEPLRLVDSRQGR